MQAVANTHAVPTLHPDERHEPALNTEPKPLTVAVTGAAGMLGADVLKALTQASLTPIALPRDLCDVTDADACRTALAAHRPHVVINCAAYTAVDKAESDEETASAVNAHGARNVALACAEIGAHLIHVSTDYVFSGTKELPYETTDPVAPRNAYGRTKLAGEEAVRDALPTSQWAIVRTSWLYGAAGPNFVKTMLRLAGENRDLRVVHDQTGAPTYTADLAQALVAMAQARTAGVIHATASGACTWYEFAQEIFAQSGRHPASLAPCNTDEYPTPAARPANSRLSPDSLTRRGLPLLPHWKDGLTRYLRETGEVATP